MKAFVSAQAGIAVVFDSGVIRSLDIDNPTATERQESDLPILFSGASDVRQIECGSMSELSSQLEKAWAQDRALHLSIIVLNSREEVDLRTEAVECLEDLLPQAGVRDFVANRFFSEPLPSTVDAGGAVAIAETNSCNHVAQFLTGLIEQQDRIQSHATVWADLDVSLFGQQQDKETLKAAAIEAGAFRLFVEEERVDAALFKMLVHPLFRGQARARAVLQAWAVPFKERAPDLEFAESPMQSETGAKRELRSDKEPHRYEVFLQVEKQRNAIKALLEKGNRDLAVRYTRELVKFQRKSGEQEHLAKSLCDLAAFAKRLGDTSLQLTFAKWATDEAPEDSWSRGQLGDAHRGVGNYGEAMNAFQKAGELGDSRVAMLGRAEVLKELGQLDECLETYDECVRLYPTDNVAKNGRAAALASFGRFAAALDLYDEVCAEVPIDPVSWTGRAEVFKDMGELSEAMKRLNDVLEIFPHLAVPNCAKGEVLREMGQLNDSLEWFKQTAERFPLSVYARGGIAKAYRDMGMFDEAMGVFEQSIVDFPADVFAYVGRADVERRRGALQRSLELYEEAREQFSVSGLTRNGLAAVLSAMGRYGEAEALLPNTPPATRSEWMAQHIRGIILLRIGDVAAARQLLEDGYKTVPWPIERSYFGAALACVEVHENRSERALQLLAGPIAIPIEAPVALIRMHAFGELGQVASVKSVHQSELIGKNDRSTELRQRLVDRYLHQQRIDGQTLFEQECDLLLLAA